MTMQEYVQYETEKALRNGKVYNWETATYGKIKCVEDINDLRFFEKKFPAIVDDDALSFDSGFSSKHTVSSRHVNEINLKNETSLSKNDEEEYNVISYNDVFPFNIIFVNDSKLDTENDDDKIDIKQSLGNISIKPLRNVMNIDVDTYAHVSKELWKTSHDTINKFFATETFIKESSVTIMIWNYFNNGMLINLVKNLYVPFGIPFDPKLFYKDGVKLEQV
ncbi:hypothetical protein Tco_0092013 [Tanacetum coccineum]